MRICIVDDHRLLTDAVEIVLRKSFPDAEIEIFNHPRSFLEALERGAQIDILITDLLMQGTTGIELIEVIRRKFGEWVKIIVLSSLGEAQTVRNALRSGANAFVSKESPLTELTSSIYAVQEGGRYISSVLEKNLVGSIFTEEQFVYHLSPREKQVLNFLCSGHTVKEMAYHMGLSNHTVQSYLKNIMKKFNVNRSADLIVFAIRNGLYHVNPPQQ